MQSSKLNEIAMITSLRGFIVFMAVFLFISCSEDSKEKSDEESVSKEELVHLVMENDEGLVRKMPPKSSDALEAIDGRIQSGTASIEQKSRDIMKDLQRMSKDSAQSIITVSDAMKELKTYCDSKGYQLNKFEQLVGSFPYLKDYNRIVYDSYTLKANGTTKFIMWHIDGEHELNGASGFLNELRKVKSEMPEMYERHAKRFQAAGLLLPNDVVLFQYTKDIKEFDEGLYSILYNKFRIRKIH